MTTRPTQEPRPARPGRGPDPHPGDEQRCELTELLVDQCAHCRPAPPGPPAEPGDLGPWIEAQYDGECVDCGEPIAPGDRIRADGQGGWLGECCGDIRPIHDVPTRGLL